MNINFTKKRSTCTKFLVNLEFIEREERGKERKNLGRKLRGRKEKILSRKLRGRKFWWILCLPKKGGHVRSFGEYLIYWNVRRKRKEEFGSKSRGRKEENKGRIWVDETLVNILFTKPCQGRRKTKEDLGRKGEKSKRGRSFGEYCVYQRNGTFGKKMKWRKRIHWVESWDEGRRRKVKWTCEMWGVEEKNLGNKRREMKVWYQSPNHVQIWRISWLLPYPYDVLWLLKNSFKKNVQHFMDTIQTKIY